MNWFAETKPYEEALIADLDEIVKIPSVLDPKTSTNLTPFGTDMVRALSRMEEFAVRDGFRYGRINNVLT